MIAVVNALVIYFVLLVVFRLAGKRSLAELTTFDFVLVLVIAEATQQALISEDSSLTHAIILIVALVGIDIGLSLLKQRFPVLEQLIDSAPLIILENGKPLKERMQKLRVDEQDILSAARKAHGLERMDQIKYAVLEQSGGISIIPQPSAKP